MELFALVVCLFWVVLIFDRSRAWPHELRLTSSRGAEGRALDGVVAVVPARNEAQALRRSLPSLLAQEELAGIVLVDDASDDGTAEVARELVAASGRDDSFRLVPARPAPTGWAGKVWALSEGIGALDDDPRLDACPWLLLSDADIEHRPDSVRSLLEQAADRFDLVSVMARLRTRSFWERLLIPTFVYFFQLLYPFRKVVRTDSEVAAAAGGCVLVRRESLAAAGGYAEIAGAVIDDVALARRIAAAGGRLWLGFDRGIRSLRPYPRLADLWRMVSRSAYDQLSYRLDLLFVVVVGVGVFFVAPAILLAAGGVALAHGQPGSGWTTLWASITLLLQALALRPAVRHHGLGWPWSGVLPVSSLLFGAMTVSSAWAHHSGRGVLWRGRKVGTGASEE